LFTEALVAVAYSTHWAVVSYTWSHTTWAS